MENVIKAKWCRVTNFGDSINPVLIKLLSGKEVINVNNPDYIIVGSIISWACKNTIIWGAGFISQSQKLSVKPKKICAVRGPLTRKKVIEQGFKCPEIYGDPVLLYPMFYKPKIDKKYSYGIIPHYIDQNNKWLLNFKNNPKIKIINIRDTINKVINDICSCEMIFSSALHGIIVADAYNIPSYWIKLSEKVIGSGFKFRDYFMSVKRKDRIPLIIKGNERLKDLSKNCYNYKIDIDLKKLYKVCPLT